MMRIVAALLVLLLTTGASAPATRGTILVVGASSGLGLEITKLLAGKGEDVTAFVRPTSKREGLTGLAVKFAVGDATKIDDVRRVFAATKVRAVVSTLGGRPGELPRPDFIGTQTFVDVAKAAGVKRMLLVTVIGAGDSLDVLPKGVKDRLAEVIVLKSQAEDYLAKSGLDYTIIRPGGLRNTPDGGKATLSPDHKAFSSIGRSELARLTVTAIDDPAAMNKIFHAFDPSETAGR